MSDVSQDGELPPLGSQPEGYRSGFVAVVGLPNAGKSTLVNALVGRDPLITSPKPQTTRYQVRCVSTSPSRQVVFVDTPGWLKRKRPIDKAMHREIVKGLEGVDVVCFVVDGKEPRLDVIRGIAGKIRREHEGIALVAVVSKLDQLGKSKVIPVLEEAQAVLDPDALIPVGSLARENLAELDAVLTERLPLGPVLYPPDTVVDRPTAFLVSEFLREQIFRLARKEVPFSTAVEIEELEEDEDGRLEVHAVVLVERDSQKGIVIGKKGAMLKDLKRLAIQRLKRFLGVKKVDLEIFVKVASDWRKREGRIRELGIGTDE